MSDATEQATTLVYAALREAQPDSVSGEELAGRLGVSRVSVKARLDQLRAEGFTIEAVPGRGVRLVAEPDGLNPRCLLAELAQLGTEADVSLLDTCESTNDEAMRRLTGGEGSPLVVITRRQSAGRGRLGRRWHSDDDGNLMLSFGFRPARPPSEMQRFTVWLGLRLAARLRARWEVPVVAKWPNDLLIGGRKLAGILTEARTDADHMRELIVGLGLNINSDTAAWPEEVRAIATSLAAQAGKSLPMNTVTATVIHAVLEAYEDYLAGSIDDELADLWQACSGINGQTVTLTTPQGPVTGQVAGLDDSAALLLRDDDGKLRRYASGDVSLGNQFYTNR